MADRTLRYVLTGVDQSAGDTLSKVADKGESTGERLSGAFSKASQFIGGEVGELVNKVGEGFEKIGESGSSALGKIAVGGGVLAGLGVGLQTLASGSKAAEQQLEASIGATGGAYDDFKKQIDDAVSSEAKFGHGISDVDSALSSLTQATQDPATALKDLNVVTDLAAYKHESLTDAADQLGKIYAGNTKILKQFGIDMAVTAGDTNQANLAVQMLGTRLAGQAAAQADTFTGRLTAMKTEVSNVFDKVASVAGGPLTALGSGIGIVSGALDIMRSRSEQTTISQLANAAATKAQGAAAVVTAGQVGAAAEAEDAASLAAKGAGLSFSSFLGPVGVGIGLLGTLGATFLTSGDSAKVSKADVESYTAAVSADSGAIGDNTKAQIANSLQKTGALGDLNRLGLSVTEFSQAITGNKTALDDMRSKLAAVSEQGTHFATTGRNVSGSISEQAHAADDLNKILGSQSGALSQGVTAYQNQQEVLAGLGVTLSSVGSAAQDAAPQVFTLSGAIGDLVTAMDAVNAPYLDASQAQLQFQSQLQGLASQVKTAKDQHDKYATSLDGSTEAGNRNAQSILAMVKSAQQQADQDIKNGKSVDDVTAAYGRNITQIETAATQSGISKGAVDGYLTSLHATAGDFTTTINANITPAMDALNVFKGELGSISAPTLNSGFFNVNGRAKPAISDDNATGGVLSQHFAVGGIPTFNEAGGEVLTMPSGTRVLPHGASAQMLRDAAATTSGGVTHIYNFNITGALSTSTDIQRAVASALNAHVGNGGRLNIGRGILN